MSYTLHELEGFTLNANDGYIGKVKDFYFDDRTWTIRHLLVETGIWLKHRNVLLKPASIKCVDTETKTITVDISMYQVRSGLGFEKNLVVSPQTEIDYLSYYGYSFYRGVTNVEGHDDQQAAEIFAAVDAVRRMSGDRHLRSCKEIIDYTLEATDGVMGYLQGISFDDESWDVQYLIVSTNMLGQQVMIKPLMVKDISWGDAQIYIDMMRHQVHEPLIFDADNSLKQRYEKEIGVHLHHNNLTSFDKKSTAKHI